VGRLLMVTARRARLSLTAMRSLPRLTPALLVPVIVGALALAPRLRAQVTELPQTIEPGGLLLREDAISLGTDPNTTAPNQYKQVAVGTTLVSAGITDSLDFEVGAQLFLQNTYTASDGTDQTHSGIGDVTLRPKWTFWKDPASGQAAAIIPYVMLPTHSAAVGNSSVEGGLILPWSMDIAAGTKAAAMIEWDEFRNISNTRYDTRWYGSAYLKWELGKTLGAYVETTLSDSTAGSNSASGTLGAGATLSLSKTFEWDLEVSRVVGSGRSTWAEDLRFRWHLL
jgi:hypothetical protein